MQIMPTHLTKNYSQLWIYPRIQIRASSIQGKGMFARESIQAGEVVVIRGGQFLSKAEFKADKTTELSAVPIDDDIHLKTKPEKLENLDEFINHNCDSNVWLQDEVTLVAKRDIATGEELTIDYALWEANPSWQIQCYCGSAVCRRLVTGNDWGLPEVQIRYRSHFSPYIETRIKKLNLQERYCIKVEF